MQLEAKEADWRAEWTARLEEERRELERQLAEEKAARAEAAEAAVASLADERRTWQQRIDVLLEKTRYLLAEKERLDKNIRQEVETQVQVKVQHRTRSLFLLLYKTNEPFILDVIIISLYNCSSSMNRNRSCGPWVICFCVFFSDFIFFFWLEGDRAKVQQTTKGDDVAPGRLRSPVWRSADFTPRAGKGKKA